MDFAHMIQEVNANEVPDDEILGTVPYHYDKEHGFELASKFEDRLAAMEEEKGEHSLLGDLAEKKQEVKDYRPDPEKAARTVARQRADEAARRPDECREHGLFLYGDAQRGLSEKADILPGEGFRAMPTLQQLVIMAELFDVKVSFLLGEDGGDPLEEQAIILLSRFRTREAKEAALSLWENVLFIFGQLWEK